MKPVVFAAALVGVLATGAAAAAETYRYAAPAAPPKIKTGDRVVTTAAPDAALGPFVVDGAEPGDLLVVTLEKLAPAAAVGYSSSVMSAASIPAGSITSRPDRNKVPWTIDTAKGVVRLDLQQVVPNTDWKSRFSSPIFEMPLTPMLGSIGTAAAAEGSAAAGPFGGAMQAPAIAAGTRVMLPVLKSGALLTLGHGFARQGDGNVTGTGIEVPLEVTFSVEVVKKKEWPHSSVIRPSTVVGEFEQGFPRIETKDSLMTVGAGPTLEEALKGATIELHHWLDDDFGLAEKTVSILVGQGLEYEIANVGEPAFTVVAKVKKAYLPVAAK